jgi:hypothetical protein
MEREPTERTENPLFSPLAPVQLSLSRGRHALSGALQQRAGPLLAIGYWLLAIGYRLCAMRYALRRRLQLVESIPKLLAALVEVVE